MVVAVGGLDLGLWHLKLQSLFAWAFYHAELAAAEVAGLSTVCPWHVWCPRFAPRHLVLVFLTKQIHLKAPIKTRHSTINRKKEVTCLSNIPHWPPSHFAVLVQIICSFWKASSKSVRGLECSRKSPQSLFPDCA